MLRCRNQEVLDKLTDERLAQLRRDMRKVKRRYLWMRFKSLWKNKT